MGYSAVEATRLRSQTGWSGLPPVAAFVVQGLAFGPTLGLLGGLGEELAWRGFFFRHLISLGFWRCSLITGAFWGLWHVPLTLQGYGYPHHPAAGTVVMLIYVLLFSPVLTALRMRARSVLAPAIFHGTADGTVLMTLALVRGGDDLTTGWGSLACIAVLVIVNLVLAAVWRAGHLPPADLTAYHRDP
jgi:membrane protease YdiL (CAAX protease family)